jgi:hypothetical protein
MMNGWEERERERIDIIEFPKMVLLMWVMTLIYTAIQIKSETLLRYLLIR